jgi:hypothetical protein
MRYLLVLAALSLVSTSAMGTDPVPAGDSAGAIAPTADAAVTAEKPKKEKKICKREEVTGSYMPQSWCLTAEEWKKADELKAHIQQQYQNRMQHKGSTDKGAIG